MNAARIVSSPWGFDDSVAYVNSMNNNIKVTDEIKAQLYGLYKRVTVGKCSEKGGVRPSFLNIVGQRKYDSWIKYDNNGIEESKAEYIKIVNRIRD